ncbi:MAG: outer membrane protein assembly factor BamC [Oceanospirillales bacterium]|nr:MAG: outer membrane protein assembly factor BamC [Oceanospirillales bacterium]
MNRIPLLVPTLVVLVLSITGCGSIKNPVYGEHGLIRDRSQDYELAESGQRLVIPENIQARETRDLLVVPQVEMTASRSTGRFQVPRPEFFYADPTSDSVNLARLEGERIIFVDEPIADVWNKTLDFWSYHNVRIARTDPRQGIIETDWIRTDGREYGFVDRWIKRLTLTPMDGPTDNKLQVLVRPDPDNYDRTSIRMRHVQFAAGNQPEQVEWDGFQNDIAYQSDMMFELLRYLSRSTAPTTANTLLAMQQQGQASQLGRDARGNPALRINTSPDRAWDMVAQAIVDADLDLGSQDQGLGKFYMTYTTTTPFDDTRKMGFFEWLHSDRGEIKLDTGFITSALGFGDSSEQDAISYSSRGVRTSAELAGDEDIANDLNDPNNPANQPGYKIWLGGRVIFVFGGGRTGVLNAATGQYEHVGRYQVVLNRTRTGVIVTVLTDEEIEAPAVVAEEILWQIRDRLPQAL